jgi:hypothetical protein
MESEDKIIVEFTRAEALVLWEFLQRCDEAEKYEFMDQAEQRALWNLELRLQPQLTEMFDPNYNQLLSAAWELIRDRED